jgi:hypothetical protein
MATMMKLSKCWPIGPTSTQAKAIHETTNFGLPRMCNDDWQNMLFSSLAMPRQRAPNKCGWTSGTIH